MSLAGARLLARWCPAERRREPDQAALVWNGRKRGPILPPHQDGERESPLRPKAGGLSTDAGAQADWLVLSATLGEDDRVVVRRHDEDGFLRSCAAPWWRGTRFGQVTGGATARV